MTKSIWHSSRLALLAVVLGGAAWVLAQAATAPKQISSTGQLTYQFPGQIPVTGWEQSQSEPIQTTVAQPEPGGGLDPESEEAPPPGQRYRYQHQGKQLEVEVRYTLADGNVSRFVFVYTPIRTGNVKLMKGMRHHPQAGYYGVLAHEGRAYLTACVNPKGTSTLTSPQFKQNSLKDFNLLQIPLWLWGQAPLLDHRCMWTLMSMPLPSGLEDNPAALEPIYKELEQAWLSWYQWWQSNFPPA